MYQVVCASHTIQPSLQINEALGTRLPQRVGVGGGTEALPNLYPKCIIHGFSSAHLLILPAVLYDKYRVNDLHHYISNGDSYDRSASTVDLCIPSV